MKSGGDFFFLWGKVRGTLKKGRTVKRKRLRSGVEVGILDSARDRKEAGEHGARIA